jgi:cell division protein ZapA
MKEEISIKVNIADVTYPLTIELKDEGNVRKAAKVINEQVKQYRDEFGISDKGNILSMIALKYASELLHYREERDTESEEIAERLKKANEMLEEL